MQNLFCPLTMFVGIVATSEGCTSEKPVDYKHPNIIFILADDLGYSELGCYGNKFNETPNLERLASQGIRFSQAYSSAPVSSPYRAALLTGQYPARIGITDYLRPDAGNFLDTNYVTLGEILQTNGYHTGIIGKWHLSGYKSNKAPIEVFPPEQGFNESLSSENSGIANGTYFYPYHFNPALAKILPDREYLVDRMNKEAVDFISRNHDKPFFLYLSHYAVHTMLHGKPEIVDYFRKKPDCGTSSSSEDNPENDPYKKWPADYFTQKNNPHLAAMLKSIDDGVGMITDKLRQLGIEQNTIIIFTSDNGGETRVTTNHPLREGKSALYEGGIRVPLIISQPGKIEGGRILETITANYDLLPTLCELAGADLPEKQIIDGVSLVTALKSGEDQVTRQPLYWHYPLSSRHFLGGRSSGAIRDGDWKLIHFFDTDAMELYNLKEDISETRNLTAEFPGKADELRNKLDNWRAKVIDQPFEETADMQEISSSK